MTTNTTTAVVTTITSNSKKTTYYMCTCFLFTFVFVANVTKYHSFCFAATTMPTKALTATAKKKNKGDDNNNNNNYVQNNKNLKKFKCHRTLQHISPRNAKSKCVKTERVCLAALPKFFFFF